MCGFIVLQNRTAFLYCVGITVPRDEGQDQRGRPERARATAWVGLYTVLVANFLHNIRLKNITAKKQQN